MARKATRHLGYRVMRYADGVAVSAADPRICTPLVRGAVHAYPGRGMFLALSAKFAVDYYAINDQNVLLTYAFTADDVTSGQLTDRDGEVTVREATLVDWQIVED